MVIPPRGPKPITTSSDMGNVNLRFAKYQQQKPQQYTQQQHQQEQQQQQQYTQQHQQLPVVNVNPSFSNERRAVSKVWILFPFGNPKKN